MGSTERLLAKWVTYGIIAAPIAAIMCRDFGMSGMAPVIVYSLLAVPMIVMVSHPRLGVGALPGSIVYALIAVPIIDLFFHDPQSGIWLAAVSGTTLLTMYLLPGIDASYRHLRDKG